MPMRSIVGAALLGVLFTALYVWLVVRFSSALARVFSAPPARGLWQVLVWGVVAALLWSLSEFAVKPALQAAMAPYGRDVPENLRLLGLLNYTLRPLALVSTAACGGVALSRMVRYPNMLGPLAGVAALVDIWGVLFGGIVSQLLTSPKAAPLAQRAMAPLPSLGGAGASGGGTGGESFGVPLASVGAGDFLFLGLFFGVLWAHRMEVRQVINWITPLVALALIAITLDVVGHLPGLLFIGLGAAWPNRKYLQFTRDERFALLYAAGFVVLLTVGLYFAITSQL
jgi:hypothetical protein